MEITAIFSGTGGHQMDCQSYYAAGASQACRAVKRKSRVDAAGAW